MARGQKALPQLAARLPDSGSDVTLVAGKVSSREVDEFGFGDALTSQAAESSIASGQASHQPSGRADVGAERRARSDNRTMTIAALCGLAICLVFALAYVLSR